MTGTPNSANAASEGAARVQTRITVADPKIMVNLLGAGDEILRLVEQTLASDVHVRGNEITITGAPADNATAERLFSELLELIAKGETLSTDAVRRTVAMLAQNTGERPADVLTLNILSRRGRTIRPKTLGQKRYVDAIDANTIVFGIGPAGTGKTYLAMAKAVQALQAKQVNRIILTRPAVEAGERLGFLPGTLNEKIRPLPAPRSTTRCTTCSTRRPSRSSCRPARSRSPAGLHARPFVERRVHHLDEAQNTTPEQMKMFLTRLGFGSKIVVTGDITQVDLPGGTTSGLRIVREILQGVDDVHFSELTSSDVVRHRLVAEIVEAYARYDVELERQASQSVHAVPGRAAAGGRAGRRR